VRCKNEDSLTVVEENCAEVAHDVDYKKDDTFFTTHSKIAAASIALHWVVLGRLEKQIVDFARRAKHIVGGVSTEGEDEDNHQYNHSVNVVWLAGQYNEDHEEHCMRLYGIILTCDGRILPVKNVALIPGDSALATRRGGWERDLPPNIVYNTTPTGSRKQAAAVGTPVRDEATAEPPASNMAVTRMFVIRPNVI
jgi:hypothetical protein